MKTNPMLEKSVLSNLVNMEISAIACNLITKDKKILLLESNDIKWKAGWYDTPSGKYDPLLESPLNCLFRELYEETGLRVIRSNDGLIISSNGKKVEVFYLGRVMNPKTPSGNNVCLDLFNMEVDATSDDLKNLVTISNEHKSFKFVDIDKLPDNTLALILYIKDLVSEMDVLEKTDRMIQNYML